MVKTLDVVDSAIDPKEFFAKYVQTRTPVVIKGLIRDKGFQASRWTDLEYLSKKAGHVTVQVEPIHPEFKQFGTDVERVEVKFSEFLDGLKREDGEWRYLTTQYSADSEGGLGAEEEETEGDITTYPPPTDALRDDFPSAPKIAGNLVLQQVNLWIGRSRNGASSGLHHDFHDNIYCLLAGHKRFVLFPPTEAPNLYPHGKIETIHPNGLISYTHNVVRSDGLGVREAAKFRIRALEKKITAAKGKKERNKLVGLLEDAIDAEMDLLVEEGGDDDFAGMELDDEDREDGLPGDEDSDGDQEDVESIASSRSKGKGKGKLKAIDEDSNEEGEPSSFSRIPTFLLHQHLSLPTTTVSTNPDSSTKFDLSKASNPFVVDINPGEMLYLPASWWHEVTSSSPDNSKSNIHMAFNYWFYPPDGLKFDEPYQDDVVWAYLRSRVNGAHSVGKEQEPSLSKRKRDAGGTSGQTKKAKY